MKKKISVILCLMVSVFLASCNSNKHIANNKWTFDISQHWHECVTKNHDDKLDVADHSWSEGVVTSPPKEASEGVTTYTCMVCRATKTESMPKLNHTHTFDMTNWENNDTHHWHKATCAHTDEKNGYEEHKGDWTVKTSADYGVDKVEERTCTICGKHQERTVKNSALVAKNNTITVDTIAFTYNAKPQPIDSLISADNKAGMIVKYVGIDGTSYEESTTAPLNAGSYQYTITIPATAEWKSAEISGKYTINKYELNEPYKKQTIEYDGKAEKDGTKRIWFGFYTLEDNTFVKYAIILDSANVGAKVSEIVLPGLLRTDNYTIDKDKVQIEIIPKKLSGLDFAVTKSELIGTSGMQVITRTVPNTDGKVSVNISFDIATLTHEGTLTLITGTPGQGEAQIEFYMEEGDEYKNYAFASSKIGTITLTTYVIGG